MKTTLLGLFLAYQTCSLRHRSSKRNVLVNLLQEEHLQIEKGAYSAPFSICPLRTVIIRGYTLNLLTLYVFQYFPLHRQAYKYPNYHASNHALSKKYQDLHSYLP